MNLYIKIQNLLGFYVIFQSKKQVDIKKNKSIETTKPKKEKHFSNRHKVDFYKSLLNMDKETSYIDWFKEKHICKTIQYYILTHCKAIKINHRDYECP